MCLLREDGSFPIRSHVLHEGIRFPLGVASAGLALLAYLPDTEIDAYLDRAALASTYGAEHDDGPLRARVRATRRAGYAVNPGLIVEGSWGMGAAVFDRDERPVWALSLTGVERRVGPAPRAPPRPPLLAAGPPKDTARLRGGTPPPPLGAGPARPPPPWPRGGARA